MTTTATIISNLQAEVEQLRIALSAMVERRNELLDVFSMVIDEMEHRDRCDGNAPGHGHKTPGIWDSDNGKLAGAPCAWCAVWSKAKELRSTTASSAKGGAA